MNEVLVIGHRNPDTDAICSAIGYAEFKRRTGMANAVAASCARFVAGRSAKRRKGRGAGRSVRADSSLPVASRPDTRSSPQ
jgi:hypothetical protein